MKYSTCIITDETPCISHPCLNGGTCIDTTAVHYHHLDASMVSPSALYTNGYYCKCSSGYSGTHCEGLYLFCKYNNLGWNIILLDVKLFTSCWLVNDTMLLIHANCKIQDWSKMNTFVKVLHNLYYYTLNIVTYFIAILFL